MSKVRIDVMIDAELLERARVILSGVSDSSLIETALRSLLAAHRHAEVDARYQAYDDRPSTRQTLGVTWPHGDRQRSTPEAGYASKMPSGSELPLLNLDL